MNRLDELLAERAKRDQEAREATALAAKVREKADLRAAQVRELWLVAEAALVEALEKLNARLGEDSQKFVHRVNNSPEGSLVSVEIRASPRDFYNHSLLGAYVRIKADGSASISVSSANMSPWSQRTSQVEDLGFDDWLVVLSDLLEAQLHPTRQKERS